MKFIDPRKQRSLFDTGDSLKKEGMDRVRKNTPEEWADKFGKTIANYQRGHEFPIEDVIDVIGMPPPGTNHNAIGSLTRSAVEADLIEPTGRFVKARRPDRHSGEVRVWRRK